MPTHTSLLDFLRGLGLTGCKEGCAEGECGACAVLVARPGARPSSTEWIAVNSCLAPAAALDGQEVVTAEGLGSVRSLHPVQRELATRGGSQCGYCTPGFVCSMAAEYYRPDCSVAFDVHAVSGNLCRCTGYRPIRDAAYALGVPPPDDALAMRRSRPAPEPAPTRHVVADREFVRPGSLDDALRLLHDRPDAVAVAGATDIGVDINLRGARHGLLVAIDRLPELRELVFTAERAEIGAALTLTELGRSIGDRLPLLTEVLPQFASPLIRNVATIGGNLGTASPIGDLAPALLAMDARLLLTGVGGDRKVRLSEYFTGYRQCVRQRHELIRSVLIPLPVARLSAFYKIAKRRFDDISSVAVAICADTADSAHITDSAHIADTGDTAGSADPGGGVLREVRIGLGGVAATPLRAYRTEVALRGRPWTVDTIEAAATVMESEGTPISDQRASAGYRSAMLGQSLRRLFADSGPSTGPARPATDRIVR
jgi:xanthine dehydrogenase small subunit